MATAQRAASPHRLDRQHDRVHVVYTCCVARGFAAPAVDSVHESLLLYINSVLFSTRWVAHEFNLPYPLYSIYVQSTAESYALRNTFYYRVRVYAMTHTSTYAHQRISHLAQVVHLCFYNITLHRCCSPRPFVHGIHMRHTKAS